MLSVANLQLFVYFKDKENNYIRITQATLYRQRQENLFVVVHYLRINYVQPNWSDEYLSAKINKNQG